MVPAPSRRALLAGIGVGLTTVLAGCSASETHSSPPEDESPVTDYAAAITRSTGERPPVVAPREDAVGSGDADGAPTTSEPLSLHTIGSEGDAGELEFASDAANVAAVRRLVAETAYESESVLVYQTRIGECYRLKLDSVGRAGDGDPDVEFCRVIRDAHTACERRARDYAAAFVRLPFPASEYGGYSVGSGSDCDRGPDGSHDGSESA